MPNGDTEISWAGGVHTFNIARLKHLRAIEAQCRVGFGEIIIRLENGTWSIDMIREPIRIGLIGGGMTEVEANAMVERWVDQEGLAHAAQVSYAIIKAKAEGVRGDNEIGKKKEAPPAEAIDPNPSLEKMAG